MRAFWLLVVSATLWSCPLLLQAHHSYGMFDMGRRESIHGTVKALEWSSPHVWLWLTVDGGNDGPVTYGFETLSPGQLLRDFGWSRHALNVGDKVTVDYSPLRSGRPGGTVLGVTLANGDKLATRLSKPAADTPPGAGASGN